MIHLPSTGLWKSAQNGDRFGDIIRSKNISLLRDGSVSLARKAMVLYSLAEDSGFGTPNAILADEQYVYVITTGHFFVVDTTATTFSILEANATHQPTFGPWSDAVIFNGTIVASGDDSVSAIAMGQGQAWPASAKITSLSDEAPHPLCVVEHINLLAVGDGNEVKTYDTDYSVQDTLTLPAEYVVTGIRWRGDFLHIATRHIYGGDAKYFIWNGTGSRAQAGYTLKGVDWIYSLADFLSSMCFITSAGQLLRFNGGGFDELASLPVYYSEFSWKSDADTNSLIAKVASRGMDAVGTRLYINIDGSVSGAPGAYLPEQPSGLWCYEQDKGLYHVAGVNYETRYEATVTSLNSNYLSFAAAHQAETGDAIYCASAPSITGVATGQTYFAIVDDGAGPKTMRLALSPADAVAGNYITLTGTPSTDKFVFDRYESMGQNVIDGPGALCALTRARFPSFMGTDVLFGASALDESLTAKGVLLSLGEGRNRGYFVAPRMTAAGVLDTIQKVRAYFDRLNLITDRITVRYRNRKRFGPVPSLFYSDSATWTSSTTFTVDTTQKDFKSAQVGDLVEVVKGAAAGYAGVITAIDASTSLYAVTIDTEVPVTAGSFDFIVEDWKLLATFTNDSTNNALGYGENSLGKDSRWLECRIEMEGRDISIDALDFVTQPKKP